MASSNGTRKKTTGRKGRGGRTPRKGGKGSTGRGAARRARGQMQGAAPQSTATAVAEPPPAAKADDGPSPMEVVFGDVARHQEQEPTPSMHELHELVEQLGRTIQEQWRELQEATRSLDELRSHAPRRSDVMEGRTYLSQDMRALVEPLQQETQRLHRRVQWSFGILAGLAVVGVPALVKILLA